MAKANLSLRGAAVLVSGLLFGPPAAAPPPLPLTGLVVFGDSLSDSGNAGRFSNGPVWVEHLAQGLGVELRPSRQGGTNHAVGGARARGGPDDLRAQARAFLAARRGELDPQALYIVYGGGNDLLAAMGDAAEGDAPVQAAAATIGAIVADLAAAGAATILVPNLPDIGLTPALRAQGPAAMAAARALTRAFNAALERELARVADRHRAARVHRLDVFALAERVVAAPAAAGFRNLTDPCRDRPSCAGMLFWDSVHPTALAHARLAAAAQAALGAPGEVTQRPR